MRANLVLLVSVPLYLFYCYMNYTMVLSRVGETSNFIVELNVNFTWPILNLSNWTWSKILAFEPSSNWTNTYNSKDLNLNRTHPPYDQSNFWTETEPAPITLKQTELSRLKIWTELRYSNRFRTKLGCLYHLNRT